MMKGIIVSAKASADLNEYYDFIAQSSPNAALRFFDAARQTFAQIARFPEIGVRYQSHQNLRKWHVRGFQKYLIFYRIQGASIEIARIIYATQNVDQILDS